MSKRSWRQAVWFFVVLSLFAVLSLAAADFSEIKTMDRETNVDVGGKSIRLISLGAGHHIEARLASSVKIPPPRVKLADQGSSCRQSS